MKGKQPTRLDDLEVQEVSLVDRPANRRPFLIIKREMTMNETALAALNKIPELMLAVDNGEDTSALIATLREAATALEGEGGGEDEMMDKSEDGAQEGAQEAADASQASPEAPAPTPAPAPAETPQTPAQAPVAATGEGVTKSDDLISKLDAILDGQIKINARLDKQEQRLTTVEKSWTAPNAGTTEVSTAAASAAADVVAWPIDMNDDVDGGE
jgi:hypothetical protein